MLLGVMGDMVDELITCTTLTTCTALITCMALISCTVLITCTAVQPSTAAEPQRTFKFIDLCIHGGRVCFNKVDFTCGGVWWRHQQCPT